MYDVRMYVHSCTRLGHHNVTEGFQNPTKLRLLFVSALSQRAITAGQKFFTDPYSIYADVFNERIRRSIDVEMKERATTLM